MSTVPFAPAPSASRALRKIKLNATFAALLTSCARSYYRASRDRHVALAAPRDDIVTSYVSVLSKEPSCPGHGTLVAREPHHFPHRAGVARHDRLAEFL